MHNNHLVRRRRLFALGFVGLLFALPSACNEQQLTETPQGVLVADNLYTDLAGFEAGLNGLYYNVRRERYGRNNDNNAIMNTTMTGGVDNAFGMYLAPDTENIIHFWGVFNTPLDDPSSSGSQLRTVWQFLYQTINASNTIILRAENPAVRWTDADHKRVVAEARLIRAWAYRHLTYMWGDVPLNLTESSGDLIRTDWERTPRAEVRKQMEQDLLFAEANLPATSSNPGKLVKAVAQHYLAELYLAMDQPDKAEVEAQAVISSGLYSLITKRYGVQAAQPGVPFLDQFIDGNVNRNQGNTEVLWAMELQQNVAGGGGNIMRRTWVTRYYTNKGMQISADNGGRGIGRLGITRAAINLYEPNDDRGLKFTIRKFYIFNLASTLPTGKKLGDTLFTSTGVEKLSDPLWPSTKKWDWVDPLNVLIDPQYGDQPYIRLAETYLLLAEAQLKLGKLAPAASAINAVRLRSGASAITAGQVTLSFILDERSRELVTEEQRRYTLLRTGSWLTRTKAMNTLAGPNIQPRDTLFPIPQSVIDANTTKPMPQNPGY